MRGDKQIDHLGRDGAARNVTSHFVAGQLLLDKAVIRLVLVERTNDVIAVAPGERPIAVGAKIAVRVGITRGVKPVLAPALAVARRGQVALDEPVIGVGGLIVDEGRHFFRRRRQTGQVETEPPRQGGPLCFRRQRQAFLLERRQDKAIDGAAHTMFIMLARERRTNDGLKRPVALICTAGGHRRHNDQSE